ncbi:MAG: hypothetical protein H6818_02805 [Phycisphaerales bacterium]|nr:hypothetical protein [Phycisphaerales bacterium]
MDKRKKRVLTVLVLGSVVLVWRVYAISVKYLPSSAVAQPQPISVEAAVAPPAAPPAAPARGLSPEALARRLELQANVAERAWGRDPFEGLEAAPTANGATTPQRDVELAKAPPAPALDIVGVSALDDDWIVVVNGIVYRVGDAMPAGFVVRRITRNTMTLEFKGWAYVYSLGKPEPTIARIEGGDEEIP